MKMEIIESDLKQIFQWLQLLNNKVDDLDKRIIKIERGGEERLKVLELLKEWHYYNK